LRSLSAEEKEKSKEEKIGFKGRMHFLYASALVLLKGEIMSKYRCTVCNYIYDPAVGDSTQGISLGTAFEDLPDSWVCPDCGVGKDMFEKVS